MFQDIGAQAPADKCGPVALPADEAANLIRSYPDLGPDELARLTDLYRQLSALDVALIVSDDELGPKFGAIVREHRAKFRTPFRHYAVLVWMAIVGIAVIFWAMATAS